MDEETAVCNGVYSCGSTAYRVGTYVYNWVLLHVYAY